MPIPTISPMKGADDRGADDSTTVTLTLAELKATCVGAMREALESDERDRAIRATLSDEAVMRTQISEAENGKTYGRHSPVAGHIIHRFETHIHPDNPSFECHRADYPGRILGIVAEARRHLTVDLSGFRLRNQGPSQKRPVQSSNDQSLPKAPAS